MRRAAASIVLSLLISAPAVAQDARLAGRLPPPVLDRVTVVVDSLRSVGLPTEPLVDKALEGASKRASGDRIVAAVRTLAGDLGVARSALGLRAGESELVAGAAAIRAGASRGDLARLRAEREGPLTVPLAVLANLMARGVPTDTAAAVVQRLAASGAPDAEFTDLQAEIERDIGAGAAPAAAASVRGNARDGDGAQPGSSGAANPGRGNSGGKPGTAGGKPGNPGGNAGGNAGNPGGGPGKAGSPGRGPGAGSPNPGGGNGPPQAAPGSGRGRGQRPPAQKPQQPGNPRPK
jgi:hypothetical protein